MYKRSLGSMIVLLVEVTVEVSITIEDEFIEGTTM